MTVLTRTLDDPGRMVVCTSVTSTGTIMVEGKTNLTKDISNKILIFLSYSFLPHTYRRVGQH